MQDKSNKACNTCYNDRSNIRLPFKPKRSSSGYLFQ